MVKLKINVNHSGYVLFYVQQEVLDLFLGEFVASEDVGGWSVISDHKL